MEHTSFNIASNIDRESGEPNFEVIVKGDSKMPFHHDDLKVKAVIALLNSIDIKHYIEDSLEDEGYRSAEEIIELTQTVFGMGI